VEPVASERIFLSQPLETVYSTIRKTGGFIMSEQLKHKLEELQNELKQIHSDDPKLQKLAGDVDAVLKQTGEVSSALLHSLQHTAEELEVNHPQLTAIINNITTSLSSLGI
jgi:DNA repair ATPase RecN